METNLSYRVIIAGLGTAALLVACPSASPPTKSDASIEDGAIAETGPRPDAAENRDAEPQIDLGPADRGGGDDLVPLDASDAGDNTDAAGGETGPRPDGGATNLRERSCNTIVRYRPNMSGATVFVAGPFNSWQPAATAMTDADGDGEYTAELSLAPGIYPYKFVVNGNWILDPSHQYRAYENKVENSGLRVPDCTEPLLELSTKDLAIEGEGRGRARFVLSYTEGKNGTGPAPEAFKLEYRSDRQAWRPLTSSEWSWNPGDWTLTINVQGLVDGKHTFRIIAQNKEGKAAESVILPFWVEARTFEWRDGLMYMIMIDRFKDGEPSNNPPPVQGAISSAQYVGGDLQGITQAIRDGYFDAIGVSALWLTPFNTGPAGAYKDRDSDRLVTGYHGYWPIEPRQVDPRIGGEAALREMVDTAHQHGIRILMDFVINHIHEDHAYNRQHPEWFLKMPNTCICGPAECDWTARRLDCLFNPYMPDVNWDRTDTSEQFIADALWWMEEFDLDGARVDAVKHVPDGAVFNLGARVAERFEQTGIDYFLTGETAMNFDRNCDAASPECNRDNYDTIKRYIGPKALDGQFDFVLHHAAAFLVFAYGERGFIHVDVWTRESQKRFGNAVMTPFISSHDSSRFLSSITHREISGNKWPDQDLPPQPGPEFADAYRRMALAETWNLTIPGIPMLYYGDEYGQYGGHDPDNRRMMRFDPDRNERETSTFNWVRSVALARRDLPALRRGEIGTLGADEDFWAYTRAVPGSNEFAVIVLNRSTTNVAKTLTLPSSISVSAGTQLRDRIGGGTVTVGASRTIQVDAPRISAMILAP